LLPVYFLHGKNAKPPANLPRPHPPFFETSLLYNLWIGVGEVNGILNGMPNTCHAARLRNPAPVNPLLPQIFFWKRNPLICGLLSVFLVLLCLLSFVSFITTHAVFLYIYVSLYRGDECRSAPIYKGLWEKLKKSFRIR
jgi:hypothetical protein